MAKPSVAERFHSHCVIDEQTGCWIWMACLGRKNYGLFGFEGRLQPAHRVSYKLHKGPIPDGLLVMHSCDQPRCVNPEHLSVGTGVDNMQDCVRKGRINRGVQRYNAKLNDGLVREIRLSSEPHLHVARRLGVDTALVQRVRAGRSWRHVT